ncbi:type II toxin-antitoxin system RelE/ParE family toxin [Paenibacillus taihuensis]|nr:type II toxin-antitoxin system RelE/ParE family toxin [Paenibacillus taihuensis]
MTDLRKAASTNDDARRMFEKIIYIIGRIEADGTRAGANFIKNLKGEENANLYELRPYDERIFCCMWDGNHFVLLTHYTKDGNQTDKLQLARARRARDRWMQEHPVVKKESKKRRR